MKAVEVPAWYSGVEGQHDLPASKREQRRAEHRQDDPRHRVDRVDDAEQIRRCRCRRQGAYAFIILQLNHANRNLA